MFAKKLKFSELSKTFLGAGFLVSIRLLMISMLLASCSSRDPYLYDRPGFDADSRPVVLPNPTAPNRLPPDYYNQQQNYYSSPPAPYYQQPQYQQPAYRGGSSAYPQQPKYGSSYYSNPYAMPSPQYDGDQYYVPPTYYNNTDPYQDNRITRPGDRNMAY